MEIYITGFVNIVEALEFYNWCCGRAQESKIRLKNIAALRTVRVYTIGLGWLVPHIILVINNFCYAANCMCF